MGAAVAGLWALLKLGRPEEGCPLLSLCSCWSGESRRRRWLASVEKTPLQGWWGGDEEDSEVAAGGRSAPMNEEMGVRSMEKMGETRKGAVQSLWRRKEAAVGLLPAAEEKKKIKGEGRCV